MNRNNHSQIGGPNYSGMLRTRSLFVVLLFLLTIPLMAEKLPKPDRASVEPTAEQRVLISEGIRMHDAGRYDGAIAKYKQVLEQSPDVAGVMYELAYSYYASGDLENALRIARAGTHYRTPLLPQIHMLIGNALDDQGKSAEAIATYRDAIKFESGFALLHFNLGLSLARDGSLPEAKKSLERSMVLDPTHASSHIALASLYEKLGYPVPSIMALSRFLLIERNSPRSQVALTALHGLIGGNVTGSSEGGNLTIHLANIGKSKKDEGDFEGIDLAFLLASAAAQVAIANKESTPFKLLAANYSVMAELLSKRKRKGFAMEYYSPFFIELEKEDLIAAFAYRVHQSEKIDGMSEWSLDETDKLRAFDAWLKAYKWPKVK